MNNRAVLIAIGAGAAALMFSRQSQATTAARQLWQQNFAPVAPYDPLAGKSAAQLAQDFGAYAAYLTAGDTTSSTAAGDDASWWWNQTPADIEAAEAGGFTWPWTIPDTTTPADIEDADLGAAVGIDPWDKSGGGYVQPVVFILKPNENWRVNLYPEFASTIASYADAYGVPLEMFEKLLFVESGYKESVIYGGTDSSKGAKGIAQFMPGTGQQYGLYDGDIDLRGDPVLSIEAAAKYLAALYRTFGNWPHAVAAYNTGPGNLRKYLRGEKGLASDTVNYVAAIFGPGTTVTV